MKKLFTSVVALFAVLSFNALAQPKMEIVGGETYDWGRYVVKDNPLKLVNLDAK